MPQSNTRPLSPKILQEDLDAYAALEAIVGYKPANVAYELVNITPVKTAKEAAETKAVQDAATAAASRDDEIAAQWAFHDLITGAKTQVKAQFGDSSNELQSLGLKKKSEYKKPTKKQTP